MKKTIFFLTGPTAAGKSEVAAILAKKLNAEIVSCDSMQIYKGMDIITSKPPAALRKKVRHHLIDAVSPSQEYNASKYRREALKKIKEILKKRKVPLFVGGTGLYISVLIDGIFKEKTQNKDIRVKLYKQAARLGGAYLHRRLKKVDPAAALKIHSNDTRRLVRALEVFETTGRPISCLQRERKGISGEYEIRAFCLNLPRNKLYARIDARVERMFAGGLLPEVKKLLRRKLSRTASCAIGIKELKGYFDGLYGIEEAKRLIKRNTRQYAKRQISWFRRDKRLKWIKAGDKDKPQATAKKIMGYVY